MCGLVRNQILLGGSRYADVFVQRVREWMPAIHYGAPSQPIQVCVSVSPP